MPEGDALSIRIRHRYAASGFTIDLDLPALSGVTALFGPSGSGKTSVVNAVAGLLTPDAGRIAIGDRIVLDTERSVNLARHRRAVGYVFQGGRLFPHLTVRQNLVFGRRFADSSALREIDPVIERLGIASLSSRYPARLSGGEAQRVAIGRALLCGARLLLLDEPLAALDAARKEELVPLIEGIAHEASIPVLYVSHSVTEIVRLASTVVVMEAGRVRRVGSVADILADVADPDALGARTGGGILRAIVCGAPDGDGLVEARTAGGSLFLLGETAPIGSRIGVRVSAQDVILSRQRPDGLSALNVLRATVCELGSDAGPDRTIGLRIGDDRIVARITARSARRLDMAPGDACFAILKVVGIERGAVLGAILQAG